MTKLTLQKKLSISLAVGLMALSVPVWAMKDELPRDTGGGRGYKFGVLPRDTLDFMGKKRNFILPTSKSPSLTEEDKERELPPSAITNDESEDYKFEDADEDRDYIFEDADGREEAVGALSVNQVVVTLAAEDDRFEEKKGTPPADLPGDGVALDWSNKKITLRDFEKFDAWDEIVSLSLSNTRLGDFEGLQVLNFVMTKCPYLKKLDISRNDLSTFTLIGFFQNEGHSSLEEVVCVGNPINIGDIQESINPICEEIEGRFPQIREIKLSENDGYSFY